ncbi:hypothetical protein MTO96_020464 [Rhipicephalus appendiculatus]
MKQSSPNSAALMASSWFRRNCFKPNTAANLDLSSAECGNPKPLNVADAPSLRYWPRNLPVDPELLPESFWACVWASTMPKSTSMSSVSKSWMNSVSPIAAALLVEGFESK